MRKPHILRMAMIIFFLGVAVLGPWNSAFCSSLRVPTHFSTIQKAINAAVKGDVVQVAQGTYFEHITLKKGVVVEGGWNKNFSSHDIAKFTTMLDGIREKGPVVTGADNSVLNGFTIVHGSLLKLKNTSMGSGIYCETTKSFLITNNTIKSNEPSGIFCRHSSVVISKNHIFTNAQAGIYACAGSKLQIKNNTIYANKYSGIGTGKLPASQLEVRNNIVYHNERSGINAQYATGSIKNNIIYENKRSGISCNPMPIDIINNTIVGNGQAGTWVDDPQAVATIKNNIFAYNIDAGIRTSGKGYSNNLFFANGQTGECNPTYLWCIKPQYGGYEDEKSYKRHKGVIADPLFVDMAGHNYHLRPGSPAIDAGDRDAAFNDTHFPPSLGSDTNDIGAFGGPLTIAENRKKDNKAPKAVTGPDQLVFPGKRAVLDGRMSRDPDGDALSYKWKLIAKPELSHGKLLRTDRVKTACKTDKPGTYTIQLIVTDRLGQASEPATVKITVPANRPPKASIGDVISGFSAGDTITLYGSGSSDPDGDALRYKWSLLFKPENSKAVIREPTATNIPFQVDVDGGYTVQLTVNDGTTDSKPVALTFSTRNPVHEGTRNVPKEYSTIQAAIDAAQAGDNIIVQKGIYKELLVIDKSVNLIGKDWPVIDGGSLPGNKNTISVFYLGDSAGRIEGFVITGGGKGDLGHGINIWDSSPEIYHNKIMGNNHGMGIHGSPALTGKVQVHGNLIYDNKVGIGNGKDSEGRIFNNRIYNNHVVGIGCRGKGAPRIEANYIYGNRIGIGAREVAAPRIEGNRIFLNTDGIVISPLSTIKGFAYRDIIINNNLIVRNDHLGINITSFNLSKIIITNNTIDSNNKTERKIRGGGIVLGYPQAATFTAVVENNIITNNKVGGIIKYVGSENFSEPGAKLLNDKNDLWNNAINCLECKPGEHSISNDPGFLSTDVINPGAYKVDLSGMQGIGYHFSKAAFAELPAE